MRLNYMKTKTIEERAKEYGSKKGDISLSPIYNEALASIYEEAYIAGATEQKQIDIIHMKQFLTRESAYNGSMSCVDDLLIEELCKAMEE